MKIYTSYFGNLRNINAADLIPVAICQFPPRFYKGRVFSLLAPPAELIRSIKAGEIGETEYTDIYTREILRPLESPERVISHLRYISELEQGKDIALLCYERPEDFCHRHIVAEWLGPDVLEFEIYKRK